MQRAAYWLAVLIAAGVTVAGCVTAYDGYRGQSDPGAVVRAYFAALARDDAPAALALGDPAPGSLVYLTNEVLRQQLRIAAISDVRTGAAVGAGDQRTVHYSTVLRFASGPQTIAGEVGVRRDGDSWRLVRTAASVQLDPVGATSRFTIAGTEIPDERIVLFPGAVPVVPDTPNLRARSSGVVVFGGPGVVSIGVEASASGRQAVLTAMRQLLTKCFPTGRPSGAGCPLPAGPRVVPTSARGTLHLDDLGKLTCTVSSSASGAIEVSGTVHITGSYQRLDDNNIAHTVHSTFGVDVRAMTPSVGKPQLQFEVGP